MKNTTSKQNNSDNAVDSMHYVPPHDIVTNIERSGRFFQPTEEAVIDLATSINDVGQLQPVVCRPLSDKRLECVCGFTRIRAISKLREGFTAADGRHIHVPDALVRVEVEDCSDLDARCKTISENWFRSEQSDMDMAYNVNILLAAPYNKTNKDIAALYGVQMSYTSRVRGLLRLPREIQMEIHRGRVSMDAALKILDTPEHLRLTVMNLASQNRNDKGKITTPVVLDAVKIALGEIGQSAEVGVKPAIPTTAQRIAPTRAGDPLRLSQSDESDGWTQIRAAKPKLTAVIAAIEEWRAGKINVIALAECLDRHFTE